MPSSAKRMPRRVYVDRDFQRKTNELVQRHIGHHPSRGSVSTSRSTAQPSRLIKQRKGGKTTKVINLVKSIEKTAEEDSDDPYLIAMAERAKAVQESFEDRQNNTARRWPNC